MEMENQVMCDFLEERLFPAKSVDMPWIFTLVLVQKIACGSPTQELKNPIPDFVEAYSFRELLDKTYPNNFYSVEPQSLYNIPPMVMSGIISTIVTSASRKGGEGFFMPLTLEMGSWKWVKKNPKQIFDLLGVYNPILPHRRRRVLRDHKTFMDFLHRAVLSDEWMRFIG